MHCDLVIVGAGVAGLSAAVAARDHGLTTVIVDKGRWQEGARTIPRYPNAATKIAQGGIAVTGLSDIELDTSLTKPSAYTSPTLSTLAPGSATKRPSPPLSAGAQKPYRNSSMQAPTSTPPRKDH